MKNYPAFSIQDILWNLSAPYVKCLMEDATSVQYLDEEQAKEYKRWKSDQNATTADNLDDVAAMLGLPPKKKKLKK